MKIFFMLASMCLLILIAVGRADIGYGISPLGSLTSMPPTAPTLLSPANSTTSVPVIPPLAWTAVIHTASYRVQISSKADFSVLLVDQSGIKNSTYTLSSALSYNTLFYWRVNADNVAGSGDASSTWSFTTFKYPQNHFSFKQGTDESYSIVIDAATLDGVALKPGDEIGVFTPAGLCAGAAMWTDKPPLTLAVWSDDSQTPEVDGFRAAESMSFRIWPVAANTAADYPATALYTLGNGTFNNGSYARISNLAGLTSVTQTIPMNQRWNWISMQVQPEVTDAALIMAPVKKLVIMSNAAGKSYIPGVINNIGAINVLDGYKVYLSSADTLRLKGRPVAASTPIVLTTRWNFVSFLPTTTMTADLALASVSTNLAIAKNDAGGFYIPGVANSMGNLTPNKGYRLYLNNPDTLVYPSLTVLQKNAAPAVTTIPTRHFRHAAYTGNSYCVLITSVKVDGCEAQSGDEIGLFTENGICVGGGMYFGADLMMPAAWEDDPTTREQDGFNPGEKMTFKLWRSQEQREYDLAADFNHGDDAFAGSDYASVALSIQSAPQAFSVQQNYPNPFNPETTIKFNLPAEGRVLLTVYNLSGQEIRQLLDENFAAGLHTATWDGRDGAGHIAPTGVYLYVVKSGLYTETKKMIFVK